MTRTLRVTAFLAMGFLVASSFAAAQEVTLPKPYFTGEASIGLLDRSDVSSSKFTEYREVPKGVSIPLFSVAGYQQGVDFALYGEKVRQTDQRFFGHSEFNWFGVSFDYNQIPHNMGNDGKVIFAETDPGVWNMSATLRQSLGATVDATPTTPAPSQRTYTFYNNLLAPTFAAANSVDISGLRQDGYVTFDFGKKLPFDLSFTYMRDVKTGSRGENGGTLYSVTSTVIDVPTPLNEVTQDFGLRFAYNYKKMASFYATFNRNLYNDRQDALIVDDPFRATDLAYSSTSVPGGPAQGRFGTPPDNQASREAFGFALKFAKQTRIGGDFAFNQWNQNEQFLPYTINSAVVTGTGAPANLTSSLPAQSMNGKIGTTTLNFNFASRPIKGLGVRAKYRYYNLDNNTTPIVWTGNVGAGDVERRWSPTTINDDTPFGFATASPYSNSTKRFDAQVSYDIKALTLEGAFRRASLSRTYRESTGGNDNGYAFTALYRTKDWINFRGVYDWSHRTAKGWDTTDTDVTVYGLTADEAERKTSRTGIQVELTPVEKIGVVFAYFRRNDDYPNRPDRIALSGGVPVAGAQPIPGTPSGLLNAKYNTYTIEFDYTPSARAELSAYYTYEKNASTNQWSTTTGVNLNNLLNYAGSDKGNTFGVNAVYHFVPEKWTVAFNLVSQKVDGLLGVTANQAGAFYTGRVTAGINPPIQNITDFDDTLLTTIVATVEYKFAKAWTASAGYVYEKYTIADAFTDGTTLFPQSPLIFMKANNGDYTASVVYTKLTYHF